MITRSLIFTLSYPKNEHQVIINEIFSYLAMDSHVKRLDNLNNRLESVAINFQSSIGKSGVNQKHSSNDNLDNLPILRDYNTILTGSLSSFAILSRKIGGELSTMIDHVTRLFDIQKEFLHQAIQTKKPTNDQQIAELIKPQSNEIEAIVGKSKKKISIFFSPNLFFSFF
jgi:hypothetical protein